MPALDLFNELTQLMGDKILEPRYRAMRWENGELVPTRANLEPGTKEIAYPQLKEIGDAEIMSDAATDIPLVEITGEYDRYPTYMVMSSFYLTFQESRVLNRVVIDDVERRMALARQVIAQRTNFVTALGKSGLDFDGTLTNPLVTVDNSTFNIYTSTYQDVLDFFVSIIESLTGNYVTDEPSDIIINADIRSRLIALENPQGSRNVMQRLVEIYPGLTFTKVPETEASFIDAAITRPGIGKDRIFLYPKEESVLHRHIESVIADLVPENFAKSASIKGQLATIYYMFSCITPGIIDYPDDVRYVDIPAK